MGFGTNTHVLQDATTSFCHEADHKPSEMAIKAEETKESNLEQAELSEHKGDSDEQKVDLCEVKADPNGLKAYLSPQNQQNAHLEEKDKKQSYPNGEQSASTRKKFDKPPMFPNANLLAPMQFSPADGEPPYSLTQEALLSFGFDEYNQFLHASLKELKEEEVAGKIDDPFDYRFEKRPEYVNSSIESINSSNHDWGQHKKPTISMRAGNSASLKITQMAEMGVLRAGDVWRYSRVFNSRGFGQGRTEVKKECIMTGFDRKTFALSFSAPCGTNVHIKDDESINVMNITTPTMFETYLLDEDKRVKSSERPNGNAFKCFRIFRNGEDIGSLWEVRSRAFEQDLYNI